jgi:hypothetical protein
MQLRFLGLSALFLLSPTTALPTVISYTSSTSCAAEVTDSDGNTKILTDTGVSSYSVAPEVSGDTYYTRIGPGYILHRGDA